MSKVLNYRFSFDINLFIINVLSLILSNKKQKKMVFKILRINFTIVKTNVKVTMSLVRA